MIFFLTPLKGNSILRKGKMQTTPTALAPPSTWSKIGHPPEINFIFQ